VTRGGAETPSSVGSFGKSRPLFTARSPRSRQPGSFPSRSDSRFEAEGAQRISDGWPVKGCTEVQDGLSLYSRPGNNEIVVFILKPDEAEIVLPSDRFDRDTPVSAVLRHGGRDGIVRLRLRPVGRAGGRPAAGHR